MLAPVENEAAVPVEAAIHGANDVSNDVVGAAGNELAAQAQGLTHYILLYQEALHANI